MRYAVVDEAIGPAHLHADWCDAPLDGQPDVSCWLDLDHAGDHEACVPEPCPVCGGLALHTIECERREEPDGDGPQVVIRWPVIEPTAV
jgi:hypothetical protein